MSATAVGASTDQRLRAPKGTLVAVVTMRQLLESGVHFGHQTRRWNPKMKRFILTERNGIYIIDLASRCPSSTPTSSSARPSPTAAPSCSSAPEAGPGAIAQQATRVDMPYVNNRWLGGMLTNFQTVHQRIKRLKEPRGDRTSTTSPVPAHQEGTAADEASRDKDKLEKHPGGIRTMTWVPSAIWVVDTNKEHIAVDEARSSASRSSRSSTPTATRTSADPIPGQRRRDPAGHVAHLRHRRTPQPTGCEMELRGGASDAEGWWRGKPPEWERELLDLTRTEPAAADAAQPDEAADPAAVRPTPLRWRPENDSTVEVAEVDEEALQAAETVHGQEAPTPESEGPDAQA